MNFNSGAFPENAQTIIYRLTTLYQTTKQSDNAMTSKSQNTIFKAVNAFSRECP